MTTTDPTTPTRLPQWAEEKIRQLQSENRNLQEENRRLKGRLAEMEGITLHFPRSVGKSERLLKLMANTVQHCPAQGHSDSSLNRCMQSFTSADIYQAGWSENKEESKDHD